MTETFKKLERKCPICRSETGLVMGKLEFALFDDFLLSRKFDVVACDNCTFVFYDTPDTSENFEIVYRNHYFSSSYTSHSQITAVDAVINVENDPIAIMGPYLKPETIICEIGCGRGALLMKMKRAGYNKLYGIEPSPDCVDYVREHYGIDALVGTADNIPFDISFDVIISTHVLEHVLNLQEAVKNISRKLTGHGLVYVEVPDLDEYDSQKGASPLDYITIYEHINHFTISSLQCLFEQNRFKMINSGRKILDMGTRLPLPVIYGVFQKDSSAKSLPSILPQKLFEIDKVHHWLNKYVFSKSNIFEELAELKTPIYIWGINLCIQKYMTMSPLRECNIVGLIDRDPSKQKKSINGQKIQSPEVLNTIKENVVVVIWGGPYRKSIENNLKELEFKGTVVAL